MLKVSSGMMVQDYRQTQASEETHHMQKGYREQDSWS